jgi:predicted RNA binding protein YcfA (HicA-like mRNA interferase family)
VGHANLPLASGDQHAKAFERCGWIRARRRGRGKHIILTKPGARATLSIPDHDEVKRAIIAKLLKAAELSEDEYVSAFARR